MSMFPRSLIVILALLAGFAGIAFAQADKQQRFPSAEAAATTLTEAIRKDDDKAIAAILGTGWRDLVPGNKTHEDEARTRFLESWDQGHKIVPQGDDKAIIEVGTTGWQMPIPLVKDAAGWRYDVEAGAKEIVAREIGRDELAVIQVLLAIVDAQREYATLDPKKTGGTAYARRLLSSPGKKDGLYGYYFRLLYAQGPAAPGKARDYVVNGRMIGGFGVIAWPVTYGETGVMTFIVSQAGDVYEQDLGPETAQRAGSIVLFNPDKGWDKADMTPP
jgi:Protein of unknown function (DUF2950)